MLAYTEQAKPSVELLKEFLAGNPAFVGEKLIFSGVGNRDVYNISAPFLDQGAGDRRSRRGSRQGVL